MRQKINQSINQSQSKYLYLMKIVSYFDGLFATTTIGLLLMTNECFSGNNFITEISLNDVHIASCKGKMSISSFKTLIKELSEQGTI